MAVDSVQAREIGDALKIDWNVIPPDQWREGLRVELEHGSQLGDLTNVTGDNLYKTGQIALAHLFEDPHYYKRLSAMETEAEVYWKDKKKPSPILGGRGTNMSAKILALVVLIIVVILVIAGKFRTESRGLNHNTQPWRKTKFEQSVN